MTENLTLSEKKDIILKKFNCQKTGNCCRTDGVVYATQTEINKMATELNIDITTFIQRYVQKKEGWLTIANQNFRKNCFLNDKNECRIYNCRPKQCKTYPNWPEIWKSEDSFFQELLLCPALKKAYIDSTVPAK